jgi:hypothetical protein
MPMLNTLSAGLEEAATAHGNTRANAVAGPK